VRGGGDERGGVREDQGSQEDERRKGEGSDGTEVGKGGQGRTREGKEEEEHVLNIS
jgi:hypothetical protein